jgi:hypothetical protein
MAARIGTDGVDYSFGLNVKGIVNGARVFWNAG